MAKANRNVLKERSETLFHSDELLGHRPAKRILIELYGEKCSICGWCELHPVTGKVPLDIDHIDGDSGNTRKSNLRLLCPNCHALCPTYKNLNKGNGRHSRMSRYRSGKSY